MRTRQVESRRFEKYTPCIQYTRLYTPQYTREGHGHIISEKLDFRTRKITRGKIRTYND